MPVESLRERPAGIRWQRLLNSIRLIRHLSETFLALKDTDKQIADLLQKAQFQCLRLHKDLEYLTQLHLGSNPDSTEFYGLQIDGLEKLKTKADRLSQYLSQPAGNALSHRARLAHVFKTRPATLKLFSEIQEWYASHAPSFFLLARVVEASVSDSSQISTETGVITRNVNLLRKARLHTLSGVIVRKLATRSQTLSQGARKSIRFSSAFIATSSDGTQLILDSVSAQAQREREDVREDIETLATILAQFDPVETNLLTCENIVELPQGLQSPLLFEMSLRVPPDLQEPRSLRSLLHDDDPKEHSLNDRLDLATSLTRSVVCMHAAEFVHKNIRPENILVFKDSNAKSKLFLVGFELFRAHNGRSLGKSDDSWVKGVYRHPQRQGLYPDTDFRMQHDIYSVGVCLLELGVWECLVRYSPGGFQDRSNSDDLAYPSAIFDVHPRPSSYRERRSRAAETKLFFQDLAAKHLPSSMGWKYTNVVLACLSCGEDPTFGADLDDPNGLIIGSRTVKKVYHELRSIHV